MKRTPIIVGACALAMGIAGCGGSDAPAEKEPQTASAAVPTQTSVTWDYLVSTYPDIINTNCSGNSAAFPTCASALNARLGPLEVDVMQLPAGRPRANVLTGINMIKEGYDEYSDAMCPLQPTQLDCKLKEVGVHSGLNIVSTNINREAGAS
ncbi:hypothetical protein [Gordonia sp. GN26]